MKLTLLSIIILVKTFLLHFVKYGMQNFHLFKYVKGCPNFAEILPNLINEEKTWLELNGLNGLKM